MSVLRSAQNDKTKMLTHKKRRKARLNNFGNRNVFMTFLAFSVYRPRSL
jgi:hypothetical protein